jgi:hypothetical protein
MSKSYDIWNGKLVHFIIYSVEIFFYLHPFFCRLLLSTRSIPLCLSYYALTLV